MTCPFCFRSFLFAYNAKYLQRSGKKNSLLYLAPLSDRLKTNETECIHIQRDYSALTEVENDAIPPLFLNGLYESSHGLALFDTYHVFYGRKPDIESSRVFLEEQYKNEDVIIFLAEDQNGTPMGFSNIFHSFSSVSAAPIWILNDLFVDPDFRRKGVAKCLMQAVEEEAATQGVVRVKLESATDNAPAQACYIK